MSLSPINLVDRQASPFQQAPENFYGQAGAAHDQFGRRINYLRVSLTDRCNFRCVYCMPAEGAHFAPQDDLLSNEELVRALRAAAAVGFEKIRLTGGEPTLRQGLVELVREISALPGITEVSMTTNGLLLPELARPLAEAGLARVNISIDTLDPERFRLMTRGGSLARVWAGIEAALAAGMAPLKLNCVVVRGFNHEDAVKLALLTVDNPWQVRFIEVMPLVGVDDLAESGVVATAELIESIERESGPLDFVGWFGSDPARTYQIPGARGTLGFISSVSDPFCSTCNRMRLTAEGRLHLCLLRDDELDLRAALRGGASDDDLRALIRQAVYVKPWGHGLPEGVKPTLRGMSELGG